MPHTTRRTGPLLALLASAPATFGVVTPDPPRTAGRSFDLLGATTATVGFTALVFGIVQGPDLGWASPVTLAGILGSIALVGLFLLVESKSNHPLMPLHLLRNRSLVSAMGITFIFMGTFGAQYYFFTIYLQNVHGFGALRTGLAFLPSALMGVIGTRTSEKLLGRFGMRPTLLTGLLLGAAGMTLLAAAMSPTDGYPELLPGVALLSLGQGIAWTAMFVAAGTGVEGRSPGHRLGHGLNDTAGRGCCRPGGPDRRRKPEHHGYDRRRTGTRPTCRRMGRSCDRTSRRRHRPDDPPVRGPDRRR